MKGLWTQFDRLMEAFRQQEMDLMGDDTVELPFDTREMNAADAVAAVAALEASSEVFLALHIQEEAHPDKPRKTILDAIEEKFGETEMQVKEGDPGEGLARAGTRADEEEEEEEISIYAAAAFLAHEANRAYCTLLGDYSQPAWVDAPDWQQDSAIAGALAIFNDPDLTPEQSHEGWLKQKVADGWVYGVEKDADAKTHPCMVPYSELPEGQRMKDDLFGMTVRLILGQAQLVAEPEVVEHVFKVEEEHPTSAVLRGGTVRVIDAGGVVHDAVVVSFVAPSTWPLIVRIKDGSDDTLFVTRDDTMKNPLSWAPIDIE